MLKRIAAVATIALVAGAGVGAASAQEVNLVGTWTGRSDAIVLGSAPHHPGSGGPRMSNIDFTYVIEEQEGRRFWGTGGSEHGTWPVLGTFRGDGKSFVALYDGGIVEGTIVDENTFDIVFTQQKGDFAVIATNTYRRQK